MGAEVFYTREKGKSPDDAFWKAVEKANDIYGNGGYTGTIAEKCEFAMIALPANETPLAFAERLIDAKDPRVDDKWGPAGCIMVAPGEFLFFGWASS